VLSELARTFPADPEVAQTLKNVTAKRTLTEGGYAALEGGGGSYRDALRDKEETVSLEREQRGVRAADETARLLAEYEARLVEEPKNLRLLRTLAELYTQQKQFEKALESYQRIIAAEGSSEPSLEQAITNTRLRQYDDALARLDPQAQDYEAQKSRLEGERQTYELERARKLAEQYPSDLHIRFDLGEVYYRAGKLTEAIQEFQKAQANPHRRIQALYYLGQCFMQRGIHDLAARALQNAIREKQGFDDEKKGLIYALGVVFEKMNKPEEAIEQFKLIYEADIGYKDVAAKVDAHYSKS
jgi:tetratricopeptide (TPR) repeat protein